MQSRIDDLVVGDIINRDPAGLRGWFEIAHISTLFNGEIQMSDESENESVAGGRFDVVGVQLLEEVATDDETGLVLPPDPVRLAAPSEAAAIDQGPVDQGPVDQGPVDESPQAELEVPPTVQLDFRSGPDVNLGAVVAALDGLDVGVDTYEVAYHPMETSQAAVGADASPQDRRSTDPSGVSWARRSPDLPRVAMPDGAVPVYGDTLPESPSYLNPVVVPEPGTAPLPRRRG